MENIRSRVRKLFALARNNPNDKEAASALAKASAMMLQYGIDHIDEVIAEGVVMGDWSMAAFKAWERWKGMLSTGCAYLYSCRCVHNRDGFLRFVGLRHNIEAAEATLASLIEQVDRLHIEARKVARGNQRWTDCQYDHFRLTFKGAITERILERIVEIVRNQKVALPSRQSLVLVDNSLAAADALLAEKGHVKTKALVSHRAGLGTKAGQMLGDVVKIQDAVDG